MFVHHVAFWLKPDLPGEKRDGLIAALKRLTSVETVRQIHVGTPPRAVRGVVDDSFDIGLCVLFDDAPGQAIYQDHPDHVTFVENFSDCWDRVQIRDFE